MDCARQTESIPTVPAGSPVADFITAAPRGQISDDLFFDAVHGDIAVNIGMVAEKSLDSPKIAQSFFTHVATEYNIADSLNSAIFQCPDHGQDCGQSSGVVGNPRGIKNAIFLLDRHIGSFDKHRIEVSRNEQLRPVTRSPVNPEHISFRVLLHLVQPRLLQAGHVIKRPFRLLERRRRHFVDRNLLLNRGLMVLLQKSDCGLNRPFTTQLVVGLLYCFVNPVFCRHFSSSLFF